MSGQSKVFVREATGLVKNVSFLDAVSLNLGNMSAGAALASFGYAMTLLPSVQGVNLLYANLIAFIISWPQIVVYTMMTRRVPRTGGDYVWSSRVLGGFWGGTLSVVRSPFTSLAFMALVVMSTIFAIGSVGLFFNYPGSLGLALPGYLTGANVPLQIGLGVLIVIILIAINIFKPKAGYTIVTFTSVVGVLGIIAAILVLLVGGNAGVVNYMNILHSEGAKATYASVSSSYSGPEMTLTGSLSFVPYFAIYVYPWLYAAPAVASEIKGKKAVWWNVPLSSIIVFILITAAVWSMYYAGGFAFITGAFTNPNLVYNWSFNFWTLAMGVTNNAALAWFLGVSYILWNIAIIAFLAIVMSRYFFAQAFDRYFPAKLAEVSKYGSPAVAFILEGVVVIILVGLAASIYGSFTALYGTGIASWIYFIAMGCAAAIFGLRREKGRAKATLVTAGILMALVYVYLAYWFIAYRAIWGGNALAYGYDLAGFIIGAASYSICKWYYGKGGIDITLAFKEIPPE